jgi:hypothetical protein
MPAPAESTADVLCCAIHLLENAMKTPNSASGTPVRTG